MLSNQSVFVYGTLKPGGHYWPQFCEGKVSAAVPSKIRGELYDLHVGYPGVFMRGDGWVQGYVLSLPLKCDFEQLDVLEGFEPGRAVEENEYLRLRVDCFSREGEPLGRVWAYEMTEATFQRFTGSRIDDGNWPIS
ncbi:MAG: gamma-glutamylcyclotransferase (GGCT)/AIG2-like uncharacterized protein YtfP [Lentimonas sp.]|jgi:gamma-glutamylcyclotransferase (GGCT)/AIG2-like uncharacterized protein YtfP